MVSPVFLILLFLPQPPAVESRDPVKSLIAAATTSNAVGGRVQRVEVTVSSQLPDGRTVTNSESWERRPGCLAHTMNLRDRIRAQVWNGDYWFQVEKFPDSQDWALTNFGNGEPNPNFVSMWRLIGESHMEFGRQIDGIPLAEFLETVDILSVTEEGKLRRVDYHFDEVGTRLSNAGRPFRFQQGALWLNAEAGHRVEKYVASRNDTTVEYEVTAWNEEDANMPRTYVKTTNLNGQLEVQEGRVVSSAESPSPSRFRLPHYGIEEPVASSSPWARTYILAVVGLLLVIGSVLIARRRRP